MKTVYLCGPMHCYSGDQVEWDKKVDGWRDKATKILSDHHIAVLDPTNRPYVGHNYKEIVEADLEEVRKSDALLAYLPFVPMAGTPMEIFFAAHVCRIPVFGYGGNDGPWIKYFVDMHDDMDKAIEALVNGLQ